MLARTKTLFRRKEKFIQSGETMKQLTISSDIKGTLFYSIS